MQASEEEDYDEFGVMSTRLVSIRYAFLRKSLCGRIAYCGMFEVKSRALAEASNGQADKQCLTNPIYAPTRLTTAPSLIV